MLKKYSELHGVSGRETKVAEEFRRDIAPYCDSTEIDTMGSVIGIINPGQEKSIMIAAHMDEVGVMVRYITPQGYLQFVAIGGLVPASIQDQEVKFENGVIGVIGSTPPHLLAPGQTQKLEDMYIDIGAKDAEAVKKMGIKIGSVATIESEFKEIGDFYMGKALDDRAGMVAMLEAIKELKDPKLTIYIVGSVQEEVGLKGARAAVLKYNPTYAIAIDVTMAGDNPGVPISKAPVECGKGPVLVIADGAGRGIISSMLLNEKIIDIVSKTDSFLQEEVSSGGTTDATMMQLIGETRHATTLSIPTRYIHAPRTVMHKNDYHMLVDVLKEILNCLE
jgi:endoglucanase